MKDQAPTGPAAAASLGGGDVPAAVATIPVRTPGLVDPLVEKGCCPDPQDPTPVTTTTVAAAPAVVSAVPPSAGAAPPATMEGC